MPLETYRQVFVIVGAWLLTLAPLTILCVCGIMGGPFLAYSGLGMFIAISCWKWWQIRSKHDEADSSVGGANWLEPIEVDEVVDDFLQIKLDAEKRTDNRSHVT